jgi:hypothetical protein
MLHSVAAAALVFASNTYDLFNVLQQMNCNESQFQQLIVISITHIHVPTSAATADDDTI